LWNILTTDVLSAERAALTGDVTADQNSNTTAIADSAVTTAKIADLAVTTDKLAADAVTNAKLAAMAQSTFKMRAAGAGTGDPIDGTVTQALTALGVSATLTQTEVVYVSKAGNDSNDGLNADRPMLTIGTAITAAAALVTAGSSGVEIRVLDAETYDEDLALTADIHLFAPTATIIGSMDLNDDTSAFIGKHYTETNSEVCVRKLGSSSHAHYRANVVDLRGTGGALTSCEGLRNNTNGGILFADIGVMFVGASGLGVTDGGSSTLGHIHFNIKDLYLTGNSGVAIGVSASASNIIGYVDHILELGTPTTTTAISIANAGAVVKLTASEIIADTVYNISAGSLYLTCPKVTGTRTGTPTIELSDAIIATSATLSNTGLHLLDTNASHDLIVAPGSNLTADRTLTVTTGDTDITVNLTDPGADRLLFWDETASTWRDLTLAAGLVINDTTIAATESFVIACSDETTAITAGTDKVKFRMPYAFTVTAVRASLSTAQASGNIFTVDIQESGTTILGTLLTIDNTETTSTTAAAAATIADSALADDAEIAIDVTQIGDGTAKGLKVTIIGYRP
jgi:hypothetical protein